MDLVEGDTTALLVLSGDECSLSMSEFFNWAKLTLVKSSLTWLNNKKHDKISLKLDKQIFI